MYRCYIEKVSLEHEIDLYVTVVVFIYFGLYFGLTASRKIPIYKMK